VVDANQGLARVMPPPRAARSNPAPAACVRFFRAHYRTLVRVALFTGATKAEADDAAAATLQEVLLRWDGLTDPLAWARQAVVSNFIKDRTRGPDRVRRRMVERGTATPVMAEDPHLAGVETTDQMRQILAGLPRGEREVMALIVDGLTPAEAAEWLGRTPAAVRRSLCDARRRVRQALAEQDEQDRGLAGRGARPSREEAR